MSELGDVKIFFGKIVDVNDTMKICRCRIAIAGHTEQLDTSMLPWYWPWYGRHWLPEVNDTVPVLIFDDNFSTAFYGNKINILDSGVDETDYPNYLEIFKRDVGGNNIQLTYKTSTGIEFINGESKTQLELEKYTIFVKSQTITMTEDKIDIGHNGLQAVVEGDDTVKELHDIIKHQANIIKQMYTGFQKIMSGCNNPYTAGIKVNLAGHMPTRSQLDSENSQVDSAADTIQSELVFTAKNK